jgi:hypothetical protein
LTIGQVWDGQDVACEVTVARRHLKDGRGAYCQMVQARRVPLAEPAYSVIRDFLPTLGSNPPHGCDLFTTSRSGGRPIHRAKEHRLFVGITDACFFCQRAHGNGARLNSIRVASKANMSYSKLSSNGLSA